MNVSHIQRLASVRTSKRLAVHLDVQSISQTSVPRECRNDDTPELNLIERSHALSVAGRQRPTTILCVCHLPPGQSAPA